MQFNLTESVRTQFRDPAHFPGIILIPRIEKGVRRHATVRIVVRRGDTRVAAEPVLHTLAGKRGRRLAELRLIMIYKAEKDIGWSALSRTVPACSLKPGPQRYLYVEEGLSSGAA